MARQTERPDVEAVCIALDSAAQLLRLVDGGTLAVGACAVIESAMLAPVTLNARRWISVVITLSVSVFHQVIFVPGTPRAPGIMGTRFHGFDAIAHQVFAKGFVFDVGRLLIDPEFAFVGGECGRRHTGACIANNSNRQRSTMVSPTLTV